VFGGGVVAPSPSPSTLTLTLTSTLTLTFALTTVAGLLDSHTDAERFAACIGFPGVHTQRVPARRWQQLHLRVCSAWSAWELHAR